MADKKITIKYFLNEDVNPSIYYIEANKRLALYPVYVRVTYNRKSTKFKFVPSIHIEKGRDVEEFFKEKDISKFILRSNDLIHRVITYEIGMFGDKFSLNGFGIRFNFFTEYLMVFLVKNDPEAIELKKLIKKHKLDYLLGDISDNIIIQLGLALGLLGKDELISSFSNLLQKVALLNIIFLYDPFFPMNVHDWLLTNDRNEFKQFLLEADENTFSEIAEKFENSPLEFIKTIFPERSHDIEQDKEEINLVTRSSILLNDVFEELEVDDLEKLFAEISKLLTEEQIKLYKKQSLT